MIWLHVERAYRPGVSFTDAANFPFDKRRQLPNKNLFAVFGTPDKMVSQLVSDVFGVQCIHTRQCNKCSKSCIVPLWAPLPLDES